MSQDQEQSLPLDDKEPWRCTAKSKTTGQQCRQPAILPTTKCRYHGGASPRGAAHPRFKHGLHSRYLPKHLKRDYQRAATDPELLSLRSQAALLRTRELELTKQLGDLEIPPWGQAVDALVDLEKATLSGKRANVDQAVGKLSDIIRQGADAISTYERTWRELRDLVQEQARVVQAENRRLGLIGGFVTLADLMLVIRGILESIRTNVSDMKARQAIQSRVNQLIDARGHETVLLEVSNDETGERLGDGER